jgi:hypothetical protein
MCASRGMRRYVWASLLLLPLSILAVGCSREGTVTGTVYYKGQPMKGGMVYFFPEGKDANFPSIINMDGTYSVSKLPRGTAKISVTPGQQGVPSGVFSRQFAGKTVEKGLKQQARIGRGASGGEVKEGEDAAANDRPKNGLSKEDLTGLQKYVDPDKSGLTIDVTGGGQSFDIKLD